MQDREVLALLGVAGKQKQRQQEVRIQKCSANELENHVGAQTFTRQEALMHRHGDRRGVM